MEKKGNDRSKPNAARGRKRRSTNQTIFIVVGILILLGLGYKSFNHEPNAVLAPAVSVNPDTLPGIQINEGPWQPELRNLRDRLKAIGLPALLQEGTVQHAHQHLDLFIKGKAAPVPAMIGINPPERFISPIHTHDGSGEIHIESPTVQTYTLGQFFDIWGTRLSATCIGSYCEDKQNAIKVFVNGAPVAGDPRSVRLEDHQEIVVTYGTPEEAPNPIPSQYHSATGS